ncbi:MAG: energy transducer TonB [Bacteroidales bacterium]|nr:energy transducer TonB [Bacteroidales bacterium]
MAKEKIKAPAFDDIVFEDRNKEYGAYKLRKKYNRTVFVSLVIGIIILGTAIIAPYLNAKALENRQKKAERQVEIKLENLDQPNETVAPPPPPPPPPADVVAAAKYVPPVVVDSIKPEEVSRLMTADEAQVEVKDTEVGVEVVEAVKEEVQEEEDPEATVFVIVEEMPMFPGGDAALLDYLRENAVYPEIAKENNIQGRVILNFCVTSTGSVSKISILKSVDPELDKEAIRVVSTLPAFKPGKQGGKPVPVWYQAFINFKLQ